MHPTTRLEAEYEAVDVLRHRSLGTVSRGRHRVLGETRLIKACHADPSRFARGARTAALVDLEGVVRVLDFEENDGIGYLILEDFSGVGLDQLIDNSAGLALEIALEIWEQSLVIVEALHRLSVVHGQLTPASFSVFDTEEDGVQVVLTDLSMAMTQAWPAWPAAERLLYCPPPLEAEKLSFTTGVRRDLHAVSLMQTELIVGRRLYPGGASAALGSRLANSDTGLEELLATLPSELTEVAGRGLAAGALAARPWPSVEAAKRALESARGALMVMGGASAGGSVAGSVGEEPNHLPLRPTEGEPATSLLLEPAANTDRAGQVERLTSEVEKLSASRSEPLTAALDALLQWSRPGTKSVMGDDRAARDMEIVAKAMLSSAQSAARRGDFVEASVKLRKVVRMGVGLGGDMLEQVEAERWSKIRDERRRDEFGEQPPVAAVEAAVETVGHHLEAARDALASDRVRQSLDSLRDAGRIDPGGADVKELLSETLLRHTVATIEGYINAGDLAEAWRALAVAEKISAGSGAVAGLKERLDRVSRENKHDAVIALTTSARLLVEEGDHRAALAQLRRAGSIDPGNLEVRVMTTQTIELHAEATVSEYLAAGALGDAERVLAVALRRAGAPPTINSLQSEPEESTEDQDPADELQGLVWLWRSRRLPLAVYRPVRASRRSTPLERLRASKPGPLGA